VVIGGTGASEGNLISGNGVQSTASEATGGVMITGAVTGLSLIGNTLGLAADGSTALPNGKNGVYITGGATATVGGPTSAQRNLISGNYGSGVAIYSNAAGVVTVQGNWIGLASDGATARGNGTTTSGDGVAVWGTATAGAQVLGNVVAASGRFGVVLNAGVGNVVKGNLVGTDSSGTLARGNISVGVVIQQGATATVGSPAAGDGNTVANNGYGVRVVSAGSQASIRGNSIYANIGLGIDLLGDGSTANDGAKTANQPNLLMDKPVITKAVLGSNTASVVGFVGSAALQSTFGGALVDVYVSASGQGKTYLGTVTANADGEFAGVVSTAGITGLSAGTTALVAAATDGAGNTSEFGNALTTVALAPLANGGFESGTAPGSFLQVASGNASVVTSWVTTGNSVDYIGSVFTAQEGVRSMELSGNARGGVAQVIQTTPGQAYTLTYGLSGNPCLSTTKRLRVTAGASTQTNTVDVTGRTGPNIGWADRSINFTASAEATVIWFESLDTDSCGVMVDNVRLNLGTGTANLSGTVFEDVNYGGGAGRSKAAAGGVARSGARVELFDAAGNLVANTSTDASGNYSFAAKPLGQYLVRVVSGSVSSSRTGYVSSLVPVPTYRTDASGGAVVADTAFVGGAAPALADAGNASSTLTALSTASTTAQAVTQVTLASDLTGLDFGFNFDTVVNTNDTGQGSLRQAITNANALGADASLAQVGRTAGIENLVFMIANGSNAAGLRSSFNFFTTSAGAYNVATLVPGSSLPQVTAPLVIDAQTQPGWSLAPVIEVNATAITASVFRLSGGGSTLRGFVVNRVASTGSALRIDTLGGNTVQGNYLGLDAGGATGSRNGCQMLETYTGTNLVGGTTASQRNVIGQAGCNNLVIWSGSANLIKGNYIGTDATGNAVMSSKDAGIVILSTATGTVIGGVNAGEGNVFNGNAPISIQASTATGTVVLGNRFGLNAAGTAVLGNTGWAISTNASGTLVGGTTTGAGNTISGYATGAVLVWGPVTGVAIQGNSIYGNGGIGIDLGGDGATANDGAKTATTPNLRMDSPVFTNSSVIGSNLMVGGYVGSAAGQSTFAISRVEVFVSDGSNAAGQGKTFLGFVTTDANGNFSGRITIPNGLVLVGQKVTATATDAAGNTSEFGANSTVNPGVAGTVFEDLNYGGGAGRPWATVQAQGGQPVVGARVELYNQGTGAFVSSTTTDSTGSYAMAFPGTGFYTVRVVSGTVLSSRSGASSALLPVLTLRSSSSSGSTVSITDQVGGAAPGASDVSANTTAANWATLVVSATSQPTAWASVEAPVSLAGAGDVDFGFSFDVVTNTANSGQGSLRQAITNANTLGGDAALAQQGRTAGIEHLVFMLADGSNRPGLSALLPSQFSGGVASVALASALPTVSQPLVIDAQTQPGWTLAPVVEINGAATASGAGLDIAAAGSIVRGLVINRTLAPALNIAANGVTVQGNHLGTNAAGLAASRHASAGGQAHGLNINAGSGSQIGGLLATQRNVISGNAAAGVWINTGSGGHVLQGNYIGVGADGNTRLGNAGYFGIEAYGTGGNTIGGTVSGAGNVISGQTLAGKGGIWVVSPNNVIQGNRIGTNAAGTAAVPNAGVGIDLDTGATNNLVGGTAVGAGNVISGNGTHGIYVNAGSNTIQGNLIGTNAAGASTLGNGSTGINTGSSAVSTQIGGTAAGAGNVISGNALQGIYMYGGTVVVEGNTIGLAPDGMAALANRSYNIGIGNGTTATIGGATSASRNLIASSSLYGVAVTNGSSNPVTIANNWIGLASDGVTARGNTLHGVAVWSNTSNVSVQGNVISSNGLGVWLGSGTGHVVTGNLIGTDATGSLARGNTWSGVVVSDGAVATVGGTSSALGNVLANNGAAGVMVANGGSAKVLGNRHYGNTGLGIDLVTNTMASVSAPGDGVTVNDGAKTAGKANLLMDQPTLTAARARGNQLTVQGYVGSTAGQSQFANALVEIFVSDGDATGYGEGKTWLGNLSTDANGNFSGTLTMPVSVVAAGSKLTGTATDAAGNTSEFGPNFAGLVVDFVVNSNADGVDANPGDGLCQTATAGECTLRAAIAEANIWAATKTIAFALPNCPGAGCKIQPTSAFAAISKPVNIDGSTQAGFAGSPLVWLHGASAGVADALTFNSGTTGSTLRGLSITGYSSSAGRAVNLSNNSITVVGNWLGLAPDGVTVSGNRVGVETASANNTIGGASAADMNRAAGNTYAFTLATASAVGNRIVGNTVGVGGDGTSAVAGGTIGVYIWGSAQDNFVGGTSLGEGNVIRGTSAGVYAVNASLRNRILGNVIKGTTNLGIDLGGDGISANDGAVDASKPNNGMDAPVISTGGFDTASNLLVVAGRIGTADSALWANARVELFLAGKAAGLFGDGAVYLGSLTADGLGRFGGAITVPAGTVAIGSVLTATATDTAGNTSEFGLNYATTSMAAVLPAGFNAFETDTAANALTGTLRTKVAGAPATVAVIALDAMGTALHPSFSGTVSLSWLDARDNSGTTVGTCKSSWASLGSAGSVGFSGSARVNVALTAPASGTRRMRLKMSYAGPLGLIEACSTDEFAAVPASFSLVVTDGDSGSAGVARSLANTSASGGNVHRAGRPFTVTALARDAAGALMTGYDGTPSLQAAACLLPSGCTAGTLDAPALAAVAGQWVHSQVSYGEVGAISLQLEDTAYADVDATDTSAASRRIASAAQPVGRFVPDSYSLALSNTPLLHTANAACTAAGAGYTFVGQPATWQAAPRVVVTARNAAGVATTYWASDLMKLQPAHATPGMTVSASGAATLASNWGGFTVSDLGNGQASIMAAGSDSFTLQAGAPQATVSPAFTWSVNVADTSEAAVAGNPVTAGSLSQGSLGFDAGGLFHSGRLTLGAGHGDARAGVRMLLQLQRYTSTGWTTLTEDRGCVTVAPANLGVGNPQGALVSAGVCAAPPTASVTTAGGRAWLKLAATPGGQRAALDLQLLLAGTAPAACSGPGQTQLGSSLQRPWLLPDAGLAGPGATATWGLPSRDLLYRRELF
jgi:choice-of-anchor C domain-containing protein